MNIDTFEQLWVDYQPDRRDSVDFWNKRAPSFNRRTRRKSADEQRQRLMEHLAHKAGLDHTSAVLDIGCGPGAQSLEMAPFVNRVEGFDLAPNMIELAKANAVEDNCPNASFRVLDWQAADIENLGWRGQFELVLASRTPAVNNLATLQKMIAASSSACCMITHVQMRHSVRDQLKGLLPWNEQKERMARSFFCAFNMLFLMGYYPEVEYFDRAWESEATVEDAELMHLNYFSSMMTISEDVIAQMRKKLESMSRNGLIQEKVESKLAVMFWKI